ncbi:TolC family protein [Fulvivirgaceae bacterium BMA10]|uniref:TolC family protein n=1 Tax=Splendidivirga corallicola TaxID=3051826 RepID=A0ABT8KJ43_9BACT|nr:TolC family protein [Fulvivirgaceae bacterium BMA10]
MKRIVATTVPVLFLCLTLNAQTSDKKVDIGIIADANNQSINYIIKTIKDEISYLLGSEHELNFKAVHYADWDTRKVQEQLEIFQKDSETDIIIGVGYISSGILGSNGPYNKPVIASLIFDPTFQNTPLSSDFTSGVSNLTYVIAPFSPINDIRTFYGLSPFKKLVVLVDEHLHDPSNEQPKDFGAFIDSVGATLEIIPVGENIDPVLASITNDFDAVYFAPIFSISPGDLLDLIAGINAKKIPSFAISGKPLVELGILAGIAPSSNVQRVGRRIALNIERILDKTDPSELRVDMSYHPSLTINMATAREIGFSPAWDFLNNAELINEEVKNLPRKLSLNGAIEEALNVNWNLSIANKQVEAGTKDIQDARSNLLPQLDVSATTRIIDRDRAESSNGQQPERTSLASSTLSQVVFSEQASANVAISRNQLEALESSRDATTLDVILNAAEGYLNLLRAKTLENIQKENIRLNKVNLDLAKVRQEVGYSGPSDLYRWQSSIALANIELNNAQANRRIAEIALNQILVRPLDEEFETEEIDLNDPRLMTNDPKLFQSVGNPADLKIFTDFMVKEGINNLPEIGEIDANLATQRRFLKFTKRNLYLPSVALSGGADYLLNKSGAGSEIPSLPPGTVLPNDLTWQLALSASLPLFTGGKRSAQHQKAIIELQQLEFQKSNLVSQLEQLIRSNMERVGASYANIQLSNDAEVAALRNFELVQDAYSEGNVSVIELIDAQNQAIQAQQNAANAGYEFLIDLLNVERSVGFFYSLSSAEARADFFNKLTDFTNK